LEENVKILTSPFTLEDVTNEQDKDEDSIPTKHVAAAIKKLNETIKKETNKSLGKTSRTSFLKQLQAVMTTEVESNEVELNTKNISFHDYPPYCGEDEENNELRDQYAEKISKAVELEDNLKKITSQLHVYQDLSQLTKEINLDTIEEQSLFSKKSQLAKELKETNHLVSELYDKLKKNPQIVEMLKRKQKQAPIPTDHPNVIVAQLFKKRKMSSQEIEIRKNT